ncbi:hypothetical protein CIPAW_15G120900 [Carya illinoinensis]|uniref:TIR domain-containing protein n=1 Tax=Carya illinoinensis TaxID=32201 RepID=A0A8T1NCQ9_CARIL|nr:hypothetical protein CIPAW_15G120900 [Carya illinoinensis]
MAFQLGASSSSLSSSPSIHPRNHHVILSFRGKDVRLKFISHLNQVLRQSGIMTYMDDGDLERGEQISSEHFKAIEESSISITSRIRDIYQHLNLERNDIVRMVGIFGIGGIGKTTFSKDIYNRISSQFDGSCFLSNIRDISKSGDLRKKLDIYDADRGVNVIQDRLRFKKVLLILDDVDGLDQLKKLAGDRTWFGLGSRIIITTTDQKLLKIFEVDSNYDLKLLDENEALRLFSLHAFKKDKPLDKYVKLSKVIKYAQGLPLALIVLGSDLKDQSIHQWKSALDKYKSIPPKNIQSVLQISYDGEPLANIKKIFDSCGFFPDDGIERLKDKCLITIEHGYIWMHDLLQDMGREIVRLESPNEPGQRMLINRNASFSSGPNYLCNELRVLDWFEYPLQSLPPDFHGNKLIIFKIRGAFIRELSFIREFKNMTIMEFHDCNCLTKLPDVSSIPNLKNLKAINCENLVEVHNSVGSLKNLCHLSFFGCSKLRILPTSLKLRSLRTLNLSGCLSLRSFPEIDCEMKSLTTLALPYWSAVEELPLSIGNLTRFDESFLRGCKNLKHLPINIILRLQHLRRLGGCTNLPMEEKISSNEGQLQELARPTNSSNGSSVLQVLNRQNCFQSESNFFPISSFFTMFNSSATLTNLDRSTFVSLPTSIKGFVALIELYLKDCKKLEEIAELPPNIANVFVEGCQSLERFPEVSRILEFNGSHIRSLGFIGLEGCNKMHEKIWNYKVPNPLLWKVCMCLILSLSLFEFYIGCMTLK